MTSGFPVPSDKSVVATLVPNQVNIDMLMWQAFLMGTQYFNEVVAGASYGANDSVGSIFAGSNLLNITSANLSSNISAYTQGLQTLIANKNLLVASGTANAIILSTRVIDDSLEGGTYAKNAPLPLNFRDGLELDFVAIANNTGAVTISIPNFQGVNGALDIVKQDGSALIQGDIQVGYRYTIICDNTNNRFILKNRIASTFGKASASDITTGTADSLVITPLALKDVMSSSIISGTGWAKYSNGIITNQLQTPTISSGGSTTITLPAAYTSSTSYRCFATLRGGGIPNQSYTPGINRISNTQVIVGHFASGASPAEYDIFTIGI